MGWDERGGFWGGSEALLTSSAGKNLKAAHRLSADLEGMKTKILLIAVASLSLPLLSFAQTGAGVSDSASGATSSGPTQAGPSTGGGRSTGSTTTGGSVSAGANGATNGSGVNASGTTGASVGTGTTSAGAGVSTSGTAR